MWKNTSLWSALRPFSGSTAAWKTAIVLAIAVVLNTHALRAAEPTGLDQAGHLQVVKDSHATSGGFSWTKLAGGIQLQVHGLVKNVLFYGPEIVRVNASPGKPLTTQPSIVVVTPSAAVPFDVQDSPATLTLVSQKLRITVDKKTGALAFAKSDGTPITRESSDIPTEVKPVIVAGATTYEAKQTFILTPDESLYGLGQYNDRYMDYRGQKVKLVQTNIGIVVPLLISTKRYGIMPDIYSKMLFEDGTSGASFWAESAPAGMDYYTLHGQ